MFKQRFMLLDKIKADNGIGGVMERCIYLKDIEGYIDLLTGNETLNYESTIQEASHILLTDIQEIKPSQIIVDEQRNQYNITFIDNPVGRGHHLEVYLEFVGVYNEI